MSQFRFSVALAMLTAVQLLGCKASDSSPFLELAGPPAQPMLLPNQPPARADFTVRMKDHAVSGVTMRDAVARGDLPAARRAARAITDLRVEGELDSAQQSKLDAMMSAAWRASSAQDVRDAAQSLASLARACGDCHATFGGRRPVSVELPSSAASVTARMARHEWAVARLWDGLVVPSDDAWTRGARVLADAPLEPESLTPGQSPVPAIGVLARSVHERGRTAETAEGAQRGEAYADIMATCGDCHRWLGGGPPEAARK